MIQIGYEASRTQNSKIAPNSTSFSISWSHLKDNLATIKEHLAHHDKHSLHTKHHTLEINNVPMPAPVPPPREWQSWKPCKPELLVDLTFNNEKTWKFCTIWSDMIDHKHQTKRKNIIYSIKTCARYNHIPLLPFWQRQERCRSTRRLQCSGPDMAGQFSTSNMKINGAALDKTMEPS